MLLDQKKSKENTIQESIMNRIPGYNNQSLDQEVTKRNSLLNSHNKSAPNDSCYRLSKVFPRSEGRRGEAKNGAGVNEFRGNASQRRRRRRASFTSGKSNVRRKFTAT